MEYNDKNGVAQGVVHSWWLPVVVSNLHSLAESLVSKDDHSHWEHDWHAQSVEHGQESNVQAIGVLEMDWHLFACVCCLV